MRGLDVPARTEDFTADPVELFFDLAYVFAFSQLVGRLVHDPTWEGVGEVALLFALLWLPWQQFTWSANAVSGNGRTVRVFFLIATAASVPMAASVSTALGAGGPVFAISLGTIFLIGAATMALGVETGSAVYASTIRWVGPNVAALALLIVGSFLDDAARVAVWCVVLVIVLAAMILAGRGEWIVRSGHFAERHALIVIVALGEIIVAIGLPVVEALEGGEGLPARTVVALVASGVFAALLWWAYFDRPSPALEHRGESITDARERGRYVRDVYTWAHAPIAAGIVLAAAALEEIALHPGEEIDTNFRLMLFSGLALGVLGVSAAVWRAFHAIARERIVAAVLIGLLLLVARSWSGVLLLVTVDAIILAMLAVEQLRVESPHREANR
jgi:low temperature requirement protein LtrA